MFLMFTLHRPDVLPTGDLGVRNAAMRAYGLDAPPAPAELTALAEPWRPYRTRACLYLWRSLDNEPRLTRLPSCTVMRRLVLAALLAGAMLVAGCGGDDGASDDPVSAVPAEGGLQREGARGLRARRRRLPVGGGQDAQRARRGGQGRRVDRGRARHARSSRSARTASRSA